MLCSRILIAFILIYFGSLIVPLRAQTIEYSEDFSDAPNFQISYSTSQGEYFQWDSNDMVYQIRLKEEHNVDKFAFSENFNLIENTSFIISVDMLIKESSFGFPMGLRLVETGETDGIKIYHNGSQGPFFVINDGNDNTYNTPEVENDVWYNIQVEYDISIDAANIFVRNLQGGETIYSIEGVEFDPSKFNRFALGWHTAYSDGSWGEIYYDNLIVRTEDTDHSILAHWDFNEMTGNTLNDISGNNHHGTIYNAQWSVGYSGGALEFDGISSEVTVPASSQFSGMSGLTIEAIFKVASIPLVENYARIVAVYDSFNGFNSGTEQAFELGLYQVNSNTTRFGLGVRTGSNTGPYDGTGVYYEYDNYPVNEWIHVAAIFASGHFYLYVNGELIKEHPVYTDAIIKNADVPLTIGYSNGTNNDNDNVNTHFSGLIDEIRLTQGVLSSDEFLDFNFSNHLSAYYPFNGNANDESGNGNHGTINGAILTEDRFGNYNSAYKFDGNDFISINTLDQFSENEFAIAAWFKCEEFRDNYTHWIVNTPSGHISVRPLYNGFVGISPENRDGVNPVKEVTSKENTIELNKWYFGVFNVNGNFLELYLNGALISDSVYSSGVIGYPYAQIGGNGINQTSPSGYFIGVLDDIRIYNKFLSKSLIDSLYHEGGYPVEVSTEKIFTDSYILYQNYPNPFNPTSTIKFLVPVQSLVTLKLFNSLGEEIKEVVNDNYNPGIHVLTIDAAEYSSGVYFYSLTANGRNGEKYTKTRKMLLLK